MNWFIIYDKTGTWREELHYHICLVQEHPTSCTTSPVVLCYISTNSLGTMIGHSYHNHGKLCPLLVSRSPTRDYSPPMPNHHSFRLYTYCFPAQFYTPRQPTSAPPSKSLQRSNLPIIRITTFSSDIRYLVADLGLYFSGWEAAFCEVKTQDDRRRVLSRKLHSLRVRMFVHDRM